MDRPESLRKDKADNLITAIGYDGYCKWLSSWYVGIQRWRERRSQNSSVQSSAQSRPRTWKG